MDSSLNRPNSARVVQAFRRLPKDGSVREIIVGRVWIGNTRDASDISGILEKEIAAVVNLAIEELPVLYPREVISCRFPLLDGEGNSEALLRVTIFTVHLFISARTPILVTCSGGMSRSPAIVAAAIACAKNESPDEWLKTVTATGPHDVAPALWNDVKASIAWMFSDPIDTAVDGANQTLH